MGGRVAGWRGMYLLVVTHSPKKNKIVVLSLCGSKKTKNIGSPGAYTTIRYRMYGRRKVKGSRNFLCSRFPFADLNAFLIPR